MISNRITSLGLALIFTAIIIFLVRRDHVQLRHAVWWICCSGIVLVLGIVPELVDVVGHFLGIKYPPTLLLLLGGGMLMVKMLNMDIELSRNERRIRRLTQRLAMLETQRPTPDAASKPGAPLPESSPRE